MIFLIEFFSFFSSLSSLYLVGYFIVLGCLGYCWLLFVPEILSILFFWIVPASLPLNSETGLNSEKFPPLADCFYGDLNGEYCFLADGIFSLVAKPIAFSISVKKWFLGILRLFWTSKNVIIAKTSLSWNGSLSVLINLVKDVALAKPLPSESQNW